MSANFRPAAKPVQLGDVTEEQLWAYDGSDPKKPLLTAIKGQIYDVSRGRYRKHSVLQFVCLVEETASILLEPSLLILLPSHWFLTSLECSLMMDGKGKLFTWDRCHYAFALSRILVFIPFDFVQMPTVDVLKKVVNAPCDLSKCDNASPSPLQLIHVMKCCLGHSCLFRSHHVGES